LISFRHFDFRHHAAILFRHAGRCRMPLAITPFSPIIFAAFIIFIFISMPLMPRASLFHFFFDDISPPLRHYC
jgi:hypothetical protein